jgi:adenylate kinase
LKGFSLTEPHDFSATPEALLLVGPTGSGKSPLGTYLEHHGLRNRRCFHFDFGHQLRMIADGKVRPSLLSSTGREEIMHILATGALLEDHQFSLALDILRSFIGDRGVCGDDLIILNGLPRHEGQARDCMDHVNIRAVLHLTCSAETVIRRLAYNTGGDRTGRIDDSAELVCAKMEVYSKRILPMLEFYRSRGVQVLDLPVGERTRSRDLYECATRDLVIAGT